MQPITRKQFTLLARQLIASLERKHQGERRFMLALTTGNALTTLVAALPLEDYDWAKLELGRLLQARHTEPFRPSLIPPMRANSTIPRSIVHCVGARLSAKKD